MLCTWYCVPLLRACLCLCVCWQVSKHTFLAALKERGAVLFCPGGQAEMVHAWKAFLPEGRRELVLHTRHRGFCRWAGRAGTPLSLKVWAAGQGGG